MPTPHTGLVTTTPNRGTPTNTRRPNFPLSSPATTSPHQCKTCHNPPEQSYHIPLIPLLAPTPPRLPSQSQYSPPPPPPRSTTPRRRLGTIELSEDVPPPPPPRPVYQSFPFHPSVMAETGLFSKGRQRTIDWFVTDIGGRDLSRRFKGVFNPEMVTSLDIINDPVIVAEIFRSGFAALPTWAFPVDQPGRGGHSSGPLRGE